jgi:hypothetical protein
VEVELSSLLTSALDGGDWLASSFCRFTLVEGPHFPVIVRPEAGWVPEPVWTL